MTRRIGPRMLVITLPALVLGAALVGCGGQSDHDTAVGAEVAAAAAPVVPSDPEARRAAITRVLEAADRVDGESDRVVARCPGCALAMEGSAEHAVAVDEYELHFCSADCRSHFIRDTDASLLAMEIPAD